MDLDLPLEELLLSEARRTVDNPNKYLQQQDLLSPLFFEDLQEVSTILDAHIRNGALDVTKACLALNCWDCCDSCHCRCICAHHYRRQVYIIAETYKLIKSSHICRLSFMWNIKDEIKVSFCLIVKLF